MEEDTYNFNIIIFSFMFQQLGWVHYAIGEFYLGISSIKSFQMPMFKVRCGHSFSIKYCLEYEHSWTGVSRDNWVYL